MPTRIGRISSWLTPLLVAGACFAVAFTWGGGHRAPASRDRVGSADPSAKIIPDQRVLIYFGCSTCKPSNDPRLPADLRSIAAAVHNTATLESRRFVKIGVAVDTSVALGLAHLDSIGRFDQVLSGDGWSNEGVFKYVAGEEMKGPRATPQLLVVDRHVNNDGTSDLAISGETVRVRKVGLIAIRNWLAKGAPLPPLE